MKNSRLISAALVVAMATTTAFAAADATAIPSAPKTSEPDPGAVMSPLKKGQTAPFTGVLLSPSAAASVIAEIKSIDAKVAIEVDKAKKDASAKGAFDLKEAEVRCAADKKILQAGVESRDARIKILEDKVGSAPNPVLWASLGAAGGIAVTALTVFIVTSVSK